MPISSCSVSNSLHWTVSTLCGQPQLSLMPLPPLGHWRFMLVCSPSSPSNYPNWAIYCVVWVSSLLSDSYNNLPLPGQMLSSSYLGSDILLWVTSAHSPLQLPNLSSLAYILALGMS
jgi:hypothetical protein